MASESLSLGFFFFFFRPLLLSPPFFQRARPKPTFPRSLRFRFDERYPLEPPEVSIERGRKREEKRERKREKTEEPRKQSSPFFLNLSPPSLPFLSLPLLSPKHRSSSSRPCPCTRTSTPTAISASPFYLRATGGTTPQPSLRPLWLCRSDLCWRPASRRRGLRETGSTAPARTGAAPRRRGGTSTTIRCRRGGEKREKSLRFRFSL